jgi:hypothetical protein
MKARRGVEVCVYPSSTLALEGGGCSIPRSSRFAPWRNPVRFVQEPGWASERVWTGPDNLAFTGVRTVDRPARSKSLYQHEKRRISSQDSAPELYLNIYPFRISAAFTDFPKTLAEWQNNRGL